MKLFRYWLPLIQRQEASVQTLVLASEFKSTEIAKFLCLRCRCLGAFRKVNGVSFSSFVVPIYAAALANIPGVASRISQFQAGHFSLSDPAAIQFRPQVFPVVARLITALVQNTLFSEIKRL
jgi:hypothetical protein